MAKKFSCGERQRKQVEAGEVQTEASLINIEKHSQPHVHVYA